MPHSPPTEADIVRLLDVLFHRLKATNKLPQLFAKVIDDLFKRDPAAAMVLIETILREALGMLPHHERHKLLFEFKQLANAA